MNHPEISTLQRQSTPQDNDIMHSSLDLAALKAHCFQQATVRQQSPLCATVAAQAAVTAVQDQQAWQGWRPVTACQPYQETILHAGDDLILDFGTHLVGNLTLTLNAVGSHNYDAPLWLDLYFAEIFGEIGQQRLRVPWHGTLAESWLPLESVRLNALPAVITLPRRQAFRYLQITVHAFSGSIQVLDATVRRESAVLTQVVPSLTAHMDHKLRSIEQVGIATLRDCMQRVFEDGPKRDRRLWCGDLRLQALVNAVTFQNYDLVERSLYLLAAGIRDDGLIPGCVFDRPRLEQLPGCPTISYALLFGLILQEHLHFSKRMTCVRELFPLALHQLTLARKLLDDQGSFPAKIPDWPFVDHADGLQGQAAFTGIYLKSLLAHAHLAQALGHAALAQKLIGEWKSLRTCAHRDFFDQATGLAVCHGQYSYASQIWLTLGGAFSASEARHALTAIAHHPTAIRPKTPYLWHYMLEACFACGLDSQAWSLIRSYWGGMIRHGADTFWESYVPEDDLFSPYEDSRLNSACHAWSCTPTYFIRTQKTRRILNLYAEVPESR